MASERRRGADTAPRRWLRRCRGDGGNTLVLFPAAILILLGMGALALDSATVFLGQRRLVDLTTAIAHDAVAGIDRGAFYRGDGEVVLDRGQVERRLDALVARQPQDRALGAVECDPPLLDGSRVTVHCRGTVRPILAPMWPGAPSTRTVTATETVIGVQG